MAWNGSQLKMFWKRNMKTLDLVSKMKPITDEDPYGSGVAIIMNGSPLFTGDAGSGESEIRKYLFENDLVEGIIALPDQYFNES